MRWVVLSVAALSCLLFPASAGYASHPPALKTIRVDGNLSDWNEILTHHDQVTQDGRGAKISCSVSSDRDCRVQNEKEDMRTFAWTWDDDYVYVYLSRSASGNGEMSFWFYMDLDQDERMGRGDKVLRVRYQGSNRSTLNDLYPYVPRSSAGDPMVDGAGFADGYSLPGNLLGTSLWNEGAPNGGNGAGDAFEERIPWSRLGVPVGTGINFHVGSSNSANPTNLAAQVDDNLGGPDGGIGTFGYEDVSLTPDAGTGSVEEGGFTSFPVTLRNEGNRTSIYRLDTVSTGGLTVLLQADTDCDGEPDQTLAIDADGDGRYDGPGDSITPGADSDGDGWPDTGSIAAGEELCYVVRVQTAPGQDGLRDETTLTAQSTRDPEVKAQSVFVTYIGSITLRGDGEKNGTPGGLVPHAIEVCNTGPADVVDLDANSNRGANLTLYSDDDCNGKGETLLAVDAGGDGTWDQLLGGDSNGDGRPDTGPLATGECRCYVLTLEVPINAPIGITDRTTVTGTGQVTGNSSSVELISRVKERLILDPDYTFALGNAPSSGPGASVYFPHTVENNWHVPDEAGFLLPPPVNDQGWTVRIWSDPNGDGNNSDGQIITHTAPIPPNGGVLHLVVEVQIPGDATPGATDETLTTATSTLSPSVQDTAVGQLSVAGLRFFADPERQVERDVFAPCETIYVQASGLRRNPDGTLPDLYDLLYFDGAATNVRFVSDFVPDAGGFATDSYTQGANDAPGSWRVELQEEGRTIFTGRPEVRVNGDITSVSPEFPTYPRAGSDLLITSSLENTSAVSPVRPSSLYYVVLSSDLTRYLNLDGPTPEFLPFTGEEFTRITPVSELAPGAMTQDPLSVPGIVYPEDGVYLTFVFWVADCGFPLDLEIGFFAVGGGETDCGDGVDNDQDGLTDCEDPECARAPECFETLCDDGIDNDNDGDIDCEDPDCTDFIKCQPEICNDDVDNNEDGLLDCEDPDCAATPVCPETVCDDGEDNNNNGLIDCRDPDCSGTPECTETECDDGVDNDNDGTTDCDDFDCSLDPVCQEEVCDDGTDNDGDGDIDCDDVDCALFPTCLPETDCRDGEDNDQDGLTDCDDPDCSIDEACKEIVCEDGVDDDGDGLVDCDDPDCADDPFCAVEICNDGVDNDDDGDVDCEDFDCLASPLCPERICDDGIDNDNDGLIDCEDPSCAMEPQCLELVCDDGVDNDNDGLVDCRDPDCADFPGCTETDCDDGIDNDGDGLTDCEDPDCRLDPNDDCDGDGVVNGDDCAPADPGAFAVPPEIPLVLVRKDFLLDETLVAEILVTNLGPISGNETVYDALTGIISELGQDRGFARAQCFLGADPIPLGLDDRELGATLDGFWYLVRGRNACGKGPWGNTTFGPRFIPPGTCPGE